MIEQGRLLFCVSLVGRESEQGGDGVIAGQAGHLCGRQFAVVKAHIIDLNFVGLC